MDRFAWMCKAKRPSAPIPRHVHACDPPPPGLARDRGRGDSLTELTIGSPACAAAVACGAWSPVGRSRRGGPLLLGVSWLSVVQRSFQDKRAVFAVVLKGEIRGS